MRQISLEPIGPKPSGAPSVEECAITGRDFSMTRMRYQRETTEPWHTHEVAQMIIVLNGRWSDDSDAGRRVLRCGDLLFHPAGFSHSHVAEADTEVILIDMLPRLVGEYCPLYGGRPRSIQFGFDVLDGVPEKLALEMQQKDAVSAHLAESLLRLMLGLGARAVTQASAARPWLVRVMSYIDAHLGESISVADLASIACISESRFAHAFRDLVGESPAAYVRVRRLRAAAHLLRNTELPVHDIASATGFYDQAHLCRAFRAAKDITPIEYRRARQGAPIYDSCAAAGIALVTHAESVVRLTQ